MPTEANIVYRPNPFRQGSRNRRGDQVDSEFVQYLLQMLGDVRALWLPGKSGSTLTDKSRNARVLTWSEDVSAFDTKPSELGSGYAVTLNGTDEEGDTPDADDLSFGDGAADQPFSVVALISPDDYDSLSIIMAKESSAAAEEWRCYVNLSTGRPIFKLTDESTGGSISVYNTTSVGTAWALLVFTYDGSGARTGMRIYKNGANLALTDNDGGTYVAMENTAAILSIGARYSSKEQFFDGSMALAGLCAKALTHEEVWALKEAVNGYFGLSL
jgi:hypothetical protein